MSETALMFADIEIGQVFDSREHLMELAEIKSFAANYDPQPMHLDEDQAGNGPFGRLTASGWHTLSLTMKLMAEARPFGRTQLVGVGVDRIEFKKPVYPGTTIAVRATVLTKRVSTKSDRGFVEMRLETRNVKNDEIVVRQNWIVMVPA
jgi:acyl dehydratase